MNKQTEIITTEKNISKALSKLPDLSVGVLVAFSGGADSSALLHSLWKRSQKSGFPLAAAHLNHGIRGEEADRDELFCKNVCEKYNIPFFSEKSDIPQISRETSKSLEETARNVRYAFLEKICAENPIYSLIATAHNSDDSLETQLFNLARGSGAKGLCGIPIKRANIIRPLIYCSKKEILEYCRHEGIEYVVDSTNLSQDYMRNKIRHNVVRPFAEIFPCASSAARAAAELIERDCDCLDAMATQYINENSFPLNVSKLKQLHPAICSRVLIKALTEAGATSVSAYHVDKITNFFNSSEPKELTVPGGVNVRVEKDFLLLSRHEETCRYYEIPLFPGFTEITGTEYAISIVTPDVEVEYDINIYNLFIKVPINSDKINGQLIARQRRAGDRIECIGHSKSLKKMLCDMKLTQAQRSRIPIICDEKGVFLVPGYGTRILDKNFAKAGYYLLVLKKKTFDRDVNDITKESL